MNSDSDHLSSLAGEYFSSLSSDPFLVKQGENLARRSAKIRDLLQPERIPTLTPQELRDLLSDTDTSRTIPTSTLNEVMGPENERADAVREWLAELVRTAEAGLNADKLNDLRRKFEGLGQSFVSELLMYRFPERYWKWSDSIGEFIRRAFEKNAVGDLLLRGKKSNRGEIYFAAGKIIERIKSVLDEKSGEPVDFLTVDLFMRWLKDRLPPVPAAVGEAGVDYGVGDEEDDEFGDIEKKLARLIPDEDLRYRWLQVVADAVETAAELSDVNWSLTFPQNGKYLRLNVAAVEVATLAPEGASLVVEESSLPDGAIKTLLASGCRVVQNSGSYTSVPGTKAWIELEYGLLSLYDRYLLSAHHTYIGIASSTRRGRSMWQSAHSAAMIDYLNDLLDRDLPQPAYVGEAHRNEAEAKENMRKLDVDEILRSPAVSDVKRLRYRKAREDEARELFERKRGAFDGDDMTKFFRLLSSDVDDAGTERVDRFMPALYGQLVLQMREDVDAFNRWSERIWNASEEELPIILNTFWKRNEVKGAGISMPTALLYLKNPERYAIWLPMMQGGLELVQDFKPGRFRVADSYLHYNAQAQRFRRERGLAPQVLDLALWKIAVKAKEKKEEEEGEDSVTDELKTVVALPLPNPSYPIASLAADTGIGIDRLEHWVTAINRKKQAIIYGPPGTGKTYAARHLAQHIVGGGTGFIETVQFHPAYSYEDFMQGIRPAAMEDGTLSYRMTEGVFMNFCRMAEECGDDPCVLILDEINRANLSRVFGELMYLIEYRDRSVRLAGNGREFRVPENVRIIGTMNTADRSIALVDHALRRRFAFIELRPEYDVLRNWHRRNDTGFDAGGLASVLQQLNGAINDPHYEVGISFFLLRDVADQIEHIWRMEIEPYLGEYFLGRPDWRKEFGWDAVRARVAG